jgi:hypothetical protein
MPLEQASGRCDAVGGVSCDLVESSRGWRLDKLKQQHKIDVVVTLSMACLAAVRGQGKPGYDLFAPGLFE